MQIWGFPPFQDFSPIFLAPLPALNSFVLLCSFGLFLVALQCHQWLFYIYIHIYVYIFCPDWSTAVRSLVQPSYFIITRCCNSLESSLTIGSSPCARHLGQWAPIHQNRCQGSPRYLLMQSAAPSRPSPALALTYHFLLMTDCYCTHPACVLGDQIILCS